MNRWPNYVHTNACRIDTYTRKIENSPTRLIWISCMASIIILLRNLLFPFASGNKNQLAKKNTREWSHRVSANGECRECVDRICKPFIIVWAMDDQKCVLRWSAWAHCPSAHSWSHLFSIILAHKIRSSRTRIDKLTLVPLPFSLFAPFSNIVKYAEK